MTLPRKLQFKDRFVYHLTRQIEGDCEGEAILFPDNTTPIKFVVEMSQNEFTAMLSALMTGADLSYPEKSHEVVWALLRQVECPVSICDEILACLQPAFDEINDTLADIENKVDDIDDKLDANVAVEPPEALETNNRRICSGAAEVLEYMNRQVLAAYAQSESGFFDDASEAIAAIISALPILGQLPFDELILLANAYFESQASEYSADFTTGYEAMHFDLYCKILANNGVMTYEIWGAWLTGLDVRVPGNRASYIFARWSPAAQSFLTQIVEFVFNTDSLQAFFNEINLYYLTGAETESFVCDGADCGLWRHTLHSSDLPDPMTFSTWGEFEGLDIVQTTAAPFGGDASGMLINLAFAADTTITQMVINAVVGENIEGHGVVNRFYAFYDEFFAEVESGELPVVNGDWNVTFDGLALNVRHVTIQYIFSGADPVMVWDEVTFAGIGTDPF